MKRLAKILLDSKRPAERLGPKTVIPASRSRSPTPAAMAVSGPRTTRSIPSRRARSANPLPSVAEISQFAPREAVPAFPGAAKIASQEGDMREPPGERIFARTVTNNEDSHNRLLTGPHARRHVHDPSPPAKRNRWPRRSGEFTRLPRRGFWRTVGAFFACRRPRQPGNRRRGGAMGIKRSRASAAKCARRYKFPWRVAEAQGQSEAAAQADEFGET